MAETHLEVYRPFKGQLREHSLRFIPLIKSGLRTALKQRKALLALYAVPAIATVVFSVLVWGAFAAKDAIEQVQLDPDASFRERMAQAAGREMLSEGAALLDVVNQLIGFNQFMGLFALLAVAWFGSGLLCEDRRAGAHLLYFSRPLTRLDYFLGKFGVVSFFSLCAMLVPMLVLCLVATLASPDWSFLTERWDVILRAIAYSTLWSTVIGLLVLMASSLASRRNFALIGTFGVLMLTAPVGQILGQFVDQRLHAVALVQDLAKLSFAIFGVNETMQVDTSSAWGGILAFMALAGGVIAWRLRRLEVVE
jgi:ABC-2 type transport system permease protein